jgi:hypothetical protein
MAKQLEGRFCFSEAVLDLYHCTELEMYARPLDKVLVRRTLPEITTHYDVDQSLF